MKKRSLSIILVLCLVMSAFFSVPVFAAGTITLDKTQFTAGEKGEATISGLTDEQIENDAAIWLGKKGDRIGNFDLKEYVINLPESNVWEFNAPTSLGTYEIALIGGDENIIDKVEFTVGAPKAKAGDIKLPKTEVKLNEPMSVTINGLTDEMIENDAWLGIAEANEKIQNTDLTDYISNLPADNTYQFKAPYKFGKYEIRVFSDGVTDNKESVLFGTVSFDVVSSKAKPGDIVLSKTNVQPEEKMSITVNGLTPGEIEEDAFFAIELANEKIENTNVYAYVNDFKVGNVYEFKAPSNPGNYEVRVICSGTVDKELYSYALFGTVPFTVSGAPVDEIAAGTEGLSTWAAGEVNQAVDEKLVTDKVLSQFPKNITREEFCELAVLLYEKLTGLKAEPGVDNFTDTDNPEVLKAFKLGIVNGTNPEKTLFSPNLEITREQISAMLLRTLQAAMPNLQPTGEFKANFLDANRIAPWALSAVKFMNANDIIKGSTTSDGSAYFLPQGNTTREMAIMLVLRAFNQFSKF
ncbi:S-layer homology domain-containing protein [Lutispora saccharofermentans]|uniref:S-layer homology domain-containing protein n=1 Tax=Lutispora saccharofermentans TaxID=3024236 RepID=A0ABT1ND61_9FIRM|nr:S-layer homology domain-containing protein [Lutispora saccharofermentans]MCQ1529192.1 S-layer homology domain-containing protein [Lutispora saccharofermentans]